MRTCPGPVSRMMVAASMVPASMRDPPVPGEAPSSELLAPPLPPDPAAPALPSPPCAPLPACPPAWLPPEPLVAPAAPPVADGRPLVSGASDAAQPTRNATRPSALARTRPVRDIAIEDWLMHPRQAAVVPVS